MTRHRRLIHKQCPECAKVGRDRHRNNFVVYPDDGGHCFACGYHVHPKESVQTMSNRVLGNMKGHTHNIQSGQIMLPDDVCKTYPPEAVNLLIDCGLSPEELITPFIYYSPKWRRIIFPIFDTTDKLRGWMGRAIENTQYPKWYTMRSFSPHEYMHIIGTDAGEIVDGPKTPVVVVEDMISQLRVSKHFPCLCLFGISLSETMASQLAQRFENVVIWLDDGATSHALDHAEKIHSYGAKTYILWTLSDPKYYSGPEIVIKVNDAIDTLTTKDEGETPELPAAKCNDAPPWCDLADDLGDILC